MHHIYQFRATALTLICLSRKTLLECQSSQQTIAWDLFPSKILTRGCLSFEDPRALGPPKVPRSSWVRHVELLPATAFFLQEAHDIREVRLEVFLGPCRLEERCSGRPWVQLWPAPGARHYYTQKTLIRIAERSCDVDPG